MVPSLPLRLILPPRCAFGCPPTPARRFAAVSARALARIAGSGIASMRPAPSTGVGMGKTMLRLSPWPVSPLPAGPKSGCAIVQLLSTSLRPVTTNRSWTPPSGTPLDVTKRTSRIGPFGVMNHGTVLVAPKPRATASNGLTAGLVSPTNGCRWQDEHLFELYRGPRPLLSPVGLRTTLTDAKRATPS